MEKEKRSHFIRQLIEEQLTKGLYKNIITRFPPEPNGYLHIGHARSICLNFGIAEEFNGQCNLRFDDTNPLAEEETFVHAIIEDITWLGFKWTGEAKYASDYYPILHQYALELIKMGKAYVDSLSLDDIRAYRGTLTEPGKESPYRNRSVSDNLNLFNQMKEGKCNEGEHVLRAKIDMSSPNLNLRDPVIYRIRHTSHQRTGDNWCIYPMYDFAHPLSDAIEDITHSLCTLEFQDHRPLYEWFINTLATKATPKQIEFSRLNLSHTITSKRKLKQLVQSGIVKGWDDPRMPTLKGMKNRGYPPQAIRSFCEMTGISRSDSVTDMSLLEECVRDELNVSAPRMMGILEPLKIVIENYPQGKTESLEVKNHPKDERFGTRSLFFTRELYIDRNDFMEEPVRKYFRLAPGKEVRLRYAYIIRCEKVIKDEQGNVIELRCTFDENTLGKNPEDRKVKGVIHWVPKNESLPCQITQLDRLFADEDPSKKENFMEAINPNSIKTLSQCFVEPAVKGYKIGSVFQFERVGYFKLDKCEPLKFLSVVNLRDTWEKLKG